MKLSQLYQQPRPIISTELYPPKTEQGWHNLRQRLPQLGQFNLDYASVTYGAGGSVQHHTLQLVEEVMTQAGLTCFPHFTSIGATPATVNKFVDDTLALGIENILALRGDYPQTADGLPPEPAFRYAHELVSHIRNYTDQLDIIVGGYPEGHVECSDIALDVQHLKQKVDAGAAVVITQLFFDNASYYHFRELTTQAAITVPIVPAIMPITKLSQVQRITNLCGATIPAALVDQLATYPDGSAEQRQVGLDYAIEQCRDLLAHDVPGLHIYCLNSWPSLSQLVKGLNLAKTR